MFLARSTRIATLRFRSSPRPHSRGYRVPYLPPCEWQQQYHRQNIGQKAGYGKQDASKTDHGPIENGLLRGATLAHCLHNSIAETHALHPNEIEAETGKRDQQQKCRQRAYQRTHLQD